MINKWNECVLISEKIAQWYICPFMFFHKYNIIQHYHHKAITNTFEVLLTSIHTKKTSWRWWVVVNYWRTFHFSLALLLSVFPCFRASEWEKIRVCIPVYHSVQNNFLFLLTVSAADVSLVIYELFFFPYI